MDADFSHDPATIPSFLDAIKDCTSSWVPGICEA
jgi:hypothetical protein